MKTLKNKILTAAAATMILVGSAIGTVSCNNYLDIVPDDGIATVDMSFNMRSTAIKWLYSCYDFMPSDGNADSDPTLPR